MMNKYILIINRTIYLALTFAIVLAVIQEMPLRSYLIDPMINIIREYPNSIAYMIVITLVLNFIDVTWDLYNKIKKV
jgi:hypothetical protein